MLEATRTLANSAAEVLRANAKLMRRQGELMAELLKPHPMPTGGSAIDCQEVIADLLERGVIQIVDPAAYSAAVIDYTR